MSCGPIEHAGLSVSVRFFTEGQRLPWQRTVPGRLCVMMSGEMLEKGPRQLVRYRPADLVYKAPDEHPQLSFGAGGVRTLTIEVQSSRLATLGEAGLALQRSFSRPSSAAAALAARMILELERRDEVTPIVVEGLALELLAEACRLARPRPAPPAWLRRVNDLVNSEFTRTLTLAACAREAGVHPVHLAQCFRAQYRVSFGERIRRLRVDFAARLLLETSMPIAEIALEAGFSDQSHLTKVFRRLSGLTPAAFRRGFRRS